MPAGLCLEVNQTFWGKGVLIHSDPYMQYLLKDQVVLFSFRVHVKIYRGKSKSQRSG